jgi:uncharacterized membrane protein
MLNSYLWLKWLHIISSVLLVGTGFGSAFYLFFTNRSGNLAAQVTVLRLVVRADWWFTTPAVVVQPLTGFAMIYLAGFPLDSLWLSLTFLLYVLIGGCWIPVVWLQIKMLKLAELASQQGHTLPALYWRYARTWEWLGYPAFLGTLVIYWLMVAKPQ